MQLDMTKGRPMPIILKFFVPIFIGNMFQQFYNMVDSIIVGRYVGEEAFAAVGSTGTIMFLVLGFANGLSTGFTVLTSQKFGAKDEKGIRQSVSNAIILSVIVSVVMTIISVFSMGALLHLMNTPSNIYHYAYDYIIIITGGTAAVCFYNLFSALLRAVGNSKAPLFFLILSAVLNIFLDLLFIIRFRWEVQGAAIATIASQAISAVCCLFYILAKVKILVPHRDEWKINGHYAKKQLAVGFPMALQFGITASGTLIMQSAINRFGSTAIAGFNASSKVGNLLTQAFPALGQSMATYTGQNFGKRDIDRINRGSHVAIVISAIASALGLVLGLVLLKPAIPLFLGSNVDMNAILPWAKTYTYLSIICYMPLGILFIYRDMMQGCGYGFLPMMGGVLELAARFTTAMLSIHFNSYLLGVAGDPAAWVVTGIFDAIAYQYVIRDVKKRFAAGDKGL